MTALAAEGMAEDMLDFVDIEAAVPSGPVVKSATNEPRGVRFTVSLLK